MKNNKLINVSKLQYNGVLQVSGVGAKSRPSVIVGEGKAGGHVILSPVTSCVVTFCLGCC
jgi:hypothetical protein